MTDQILLTPKEKALIECLGPGRMKISEAARHLNMSVSYAEVMLHRLYEKTGCKNGRHPVSWAYEQQILKINRENLSDGLDKAG